LSTLFVRLSVELIGSGLSCDQESRETTFEAVLKTTSCPHAVFLTFCKCESRHIKKVSTRIIDTMTDTAAAHIAPAADTATTEEAPDTKKQKMEYPMAPDEDWPEAWLMPAGEVEDQCKENRMEPNVAFTAQDMKKLGIAYWKMDAESFEYPVKAVPWDPKDAMDPKLMAIRDARGYSYADIITVHPDHLPEFETVRLMCGYADLCFTILYPWLSYDMEFSFC
jgi:hypothetical protein